MESDTFPATGPCVYCGKPQVGLTKAGVKHEDGTWCLPTPQDPSESGRGWQTPPAANSLPDSYQPPTGEPQLPQATKLSEDT